MPQHKLMRLYDWLVITETVFVFHHDGRTYATDRYVLVDCAYVSDRTIPAPGTYKIKATQPAEPLSDPRLTVDAEARLAQMLPEAVQHFEAHPERHHQVAWSTWTNHAEGSCRIGSMGGTAVGMRHDFISRLPEGHVIVGHDPTRPMLTGLCVGTTTLFTGLVMPIRLAGPHHDLVVHNAILYSL